MRATGARTVLSADHCSPIGESPPRFSATLVIAVNLKFGLKLNLENRADTHLKTLVHPNASCWRSGGRADPRLLLLRLQILVLLAKCEVLLPKSLSLLTYFLFSFHCLLPEALWPSE